MTTKRPTPSECESLLSLEDINKEETTQIHTPRSRDLKSLVVLATAVFAFLTCLPPFWGNNMDGIGSVRSKELDEYFSLDGGAGDDGPAWSEDVSAEKVLDFGIDEKERLEDPDAAMNRESGHISEQEEEEDDKAVSIDGDSGTVKGQNDAIYAPAKDNSKVMETSVSKKEKEEDSILVNEEEKKQEKDDNEKEKEETQKQKEDDTKDAEVVDVVDKAKAELEGSPIDWYEKHVKDGQQADRRIKNIQNRLGHKFIPYDKSQTIPSFKELQQRMEVVLREKGLVLVGDSTWRFLYGAIWCLVEGMYSDSETDSVRHENDRCGRRQAELKDKCKNDQGNCDNRASFSGNKKELVLELIPNSKLTTPGGKWFQAVDFTPGKPVLIGMPCLHSLWSPGGRESSVHAHSWEWPALFGNFYQGLGSLIPDTTPLFVSTTMWVCDDKLGSEKGRIDQWLHSETFPLEDEARWQKTLDGYNHGVKKEEQKLAKDYVGPIPLLDSARLDHSDDLALFDQAGARLCTKAGIETFHQESTHSTATIIDMHAATEDGCDSTGDGRHYGGRNVQKRQFMYVLSILEAL